MPIAGAAILTAVSLGLHIVFATNAGALWRDEVTSLEIATMRTLSEMWSNLAFESFPALFVVLLRVVVAVTGGNDAALRGLGLAIGLLILAVLWLNARWFRLSVPLVSLALIGFNPLIVRYGDSIRGYGLGIAFALLSLGTIWRAVETLTLRRVLVATVIAVLSVQALYYNAVLLFASCVAAAVVTLRRGHMRNALAIVSIGGVAALSLIPYVPTILRVRQWSFIWKVPFTASSQWAKLSETLGSPLALGVWIWIGLLVIALVVGAMRLKDERALFAWTALIVGTLGYIAFLKALGYLTQPWYYILWLAFAATCVEIVLGAKLMLARAAFALLFAALTIVPAWRALQVRQTNIDVVAWQIESTAAPGDLILINPFPFAISFQHYYRGPAQFMTIPPLDDLRSHRADLLKQAMMSRDPIAPVLQRAEETLRAGNGVWLIGGLNFVPPGQEPRRVEPGYDDAAGWQGGDFYRAWGEQAGVFMQQHAQNFERVRVPVAQPVIHYENVPLSVFRGWRE